MAYRRIILSGLGLTIIALMLPGCMAISTHTVEPGACPKRCQKACPVKDGVFIHITKGPDSPHEVLMALRMAEIMADTRNVMVYCDIQAVHALLADAPDLMYPPFPSLHTQLDKLLAKKVTVAACPGCLKAAGKTPADLRPGIQVADKDKFFAFTKGRILTLDY